MVAPQARLNKGGELSHLTNALKSQEGHVMMVSCEHKIEGNLGPALIAFLAILFQSLHGWCSFLAFIIL